MRQCESFSETALRIALAAQLAFTGPATSMAATTALATPAAFPNDDATIAHALNRLTFGASVADIARVREMGLGVWIDAQLQPARGENAALKSRLASLETISMSTGELREKYEIPPNVRQEVKKARAEREEALAENKEGGQAAGQEAGKKPDDRDDPMARRAEREELAKRFPQLAQMQGGPARVINDLQSAKVLRAALSDRQLEEVMVDFWFNHFNVFARKGPIEYMVGDYERTIRAHALGKFEDLLVATARSPAMLFYLDNWQSTDPGFDPRAALARRPRNPNRGQMRGAGQPDGALPRRPGANGSVPGQGQTMGDEESDPVMSAKPPQRRTYGINENYARELMELHTLGVDGGYTQADVVEVAKAFTGWTILGEGPGGPRRNKESRFSFEDARHVKGDKKVLGAVIKNSGEKEGLEILHRLATQPATARFISTKLVRRLVSDDPPSALVQKAAATFEKTNGDVREVVRTIITSDEFLGASYRAAKVKTPFEFVVSSVRASGAAITNARDLAQRIGAMGMPLYLQQPPTGYRDSAEEWVSTSALLERMNFALDLSAGRVRGVRLDAKGLTDKKATLDSVAAQLLPVGLSANSKKTLEGEASKEGSSPERLVGLVLGSPEFQKK